MNDWESSFTHILVGDVVSAQERLESADTQSHRRELIRSVFAAIEGIHWQLKQAVFEYAGDIANLTVHEKAALLEESYSVDANGKVQVQPRFLALPTAIRLVVRVTERCVPGYSVDFDHVGWANLVSAVRVRNRLLHPKVIEDLTVTDEEVAQAISAFCWALALVIEIRSETLEQFQKLIASNLPVEKTPQRPDTKRKAPPERG